MCININNNRLISGSLRLNSVVVWELTLVALPLVISVIIGIWFPYTQKPGRNLQLMQIGSLSNGVDDLENFTSEMEWSFFVPVGFSCIFSNWYGTYQHRLRFRWRGFMYEFLPLIRKARTRCDLCRALHDFANQRQEFIH